MSLRIAIIGAVMAGGSAGRLLADRGHRVTLLEKSWAAALQIIQSSPMANTTSTI